MQPIILLVILIFLNAVFASAEIAVISMNETKLRSLADQGDKRAGKLLSLTKQPSRFLATIQVAITLASLLQSAFAAENFADSLAAALVGAGVPVAEGVLKSAAIVVITVILGYFNLVFGELVPKRIAMKKADKLALGMANMLYFVSIICAPVVWILTKSTNLVLRLLRINPEEEEETVSEEEIRMMLLEGSKKGTIQEEETEMIQNVFEFDDISVEEICTHRREVVYLSREDNLEIWNEIVLANRHTKYPVCGENRDDIEGILDTRDYFRMQPGSREEVIHNCVEPAFFIPENMKANVLFRQMKERREYFAVLIDEYGGMTGIITLHDLMEALVGDLEEKEEGDKPREIEKTGEDTWVIQGAAPLDEVEEELGITLPTEEFDTFNGFVCDVLGRVPDAGEEFSVETDELSMQIYGVKNHMIEGAVVKLKGKEGNKGQGS